MYRSLAVLGIVVAALAFGACGSGPTRFDGRRGSGPVAMAQSDAPARAPLWCLRAQTELDAALLSATSGYPRIRGIDGAERCVGLFETRGSARRSRTVLTRKAEGVPWDVAEPSRLDARTGARAAARYPVMIGVPIEVELERADAFFQETVLEQRDTIVVFYQPTFQREPTAGPLIVLDGPTGRAHQLEAWSFAPAPDGRSIVYAAQIRVTGFRDVGPAQREVRIGEIARTLGIPRDEVERAAFDESFTGYTKIARPVVLDLDSGDVKELPLVGGGVLWSDEDSVYGLSRPLYWERARSTDIFQTSRPLDSPKRLALPDGRWESVEPRAVSNVLDARSAAELDRVLAELPPEYRGGPGTIAVQTRARNLALVRVGRRGLQAVRLPRGHRGAIAENP